MTENALTDRVVLVTGGSRGIGLATVRALAAVGAQVVTMSRSPGDRGGAESGHIEHEAADVADFEAVRDVVRRVIERHGHIDGLINNAGARGARGPLWEYDPSEYARVLAVNTLGPFHMMKLVLPGMIDRGQGVVVNVSSGASKRPRPGRSMYGTSKAALDHMTIAVAAELSPRGVRVHAFHPGPVDTDLFRASLDDPVTTDEEKAAIRARYESGEVQAPQEPASALVWLLSPEGDVVEDVIVSWGDPERRAEIKRLAGLR